MSKDVKMETDSEWVDLGLPSSSAADMEFTAKLQSVAAGVSLFSKEPKVGGAPDEYLLTLEGHAPVEKLPWLQQVRRRRGVVTYRVTQQQQAAHNLLLT